MGSLIISMYHIYLKQKYSNEGKAKMITVAVEGRTKTDQLKLIRVVDRIQREEKRHGQLPGSIIRSDSNTFRGLV